MEKVNDIINITESSIILDESKAYQKGFTKDEIQKLNSIYNEINEMIRDKKVSIIKNSNDKYDVKLNENIYDQNLEKFSRSVITKRWYGYDFYFSARECGDAAAILAGSAATAGAIAGVLGLTGHEPAAIVLTVATGILGLGSAYMWYCSNCNGLDASYNFLTRDVKFERSGNC